MIIEIKKGTINGIEIYDTDKFVSMYVTDGNINQRKMCDKKSYKYAINGVTENGKLVPVYTSNCKDDCVEVLKAISDGMASKNKKFEKQY